MGTDMPSLTVLAKVSEACPLGCLYCYEGDKSSKRMGIPTLTRMVEILETRENPTLTSYIWHGAEPLTAGLDFYKEARRLQKQYQGTHKIRNGMQTNGVLLTEEMADFFAEEQIDLGFSLDGPKELHDKTRPYVNGRSSFDDTIRAIEMMRARRKKPGVIAVLTRLSLPHLDSMYQFFKDMGLSFRINPIFQCGEGRAHPELVLTEQEKVAAVTYLFDKWFFDKENPRKTDYSNMFALAKAIFTKGGTSCDMMPSCQNSFLSVDRDGEVHPCSRYSDPTLVYGNIHSAKDLSQILASSKRQDLLKRYEGLEECVACDFNFLCHGGCMHYAYMAGDIMQKDPNCGSNKAVYTHVAKRLLTELEQDGAIRQ